MVHFSDDGGELQQADRPAGSLAPVTFLPGVSPTDAPVSQPGPHESRSRAATFSDEYWAEDVEVTDERELPTVEVPDEPVDREKQRDVAATALVRSLARRGLSIAESRTRLRSDGLDDEQAASVIDEFIERGWLDDAVLAEQLVHSAMTRKNLGARATRQLLAKRQLSREAIDDAMAELPDDDAERALEFARSKARSLVRYDDETAIRRLMGMLARRGFGGSVAGNAARTALADERRQAGGSGVRFH